MVLGTLPSIFVVQRCLDFLKVQPDTLVKEVGEEGLVLHWRVGDYAKVRQRTSKKPIKVSEARLAINISNDLLLSASIA